MWVGVWEGIPSPAFLQALHQSFTMSPPFLGIVEIKNFLRLLILGKGWHLIPFVCFMSYQKQAIDG